MLNRWRFDRARAFLVGLLLVCSHAKADSIRPDLPAEVTINKDAGRGGLLIVTLHLVSGEELPMVVDTGSPVMVFDKSLESKLGVRVGTTRVGSFYGEQDVGIYNAPPLYLGGVALITGSNAIAWNLKKLPIRSESRIMGILGMACLSNYCIQLDFEAGKMRFLDPTRLDTATLGKAYPLSFSLHAGDTEGAVVPFIEHAGLLGGTATRTEIDTGDNSDGMAEGDDIKHYASGSYAGGPWQRFKHFLAVKGVVNRAVGNLKCVWDGNTYTNVAVARAPNEAPSWIGLRFLARHLVTLDFPNRTMYLKQTNVGQRGDK